MGGGGVVRGFMGWVCVILGCMVGWVVEEFMGG